MKIDAEFKEALADLSSKEKDKLILRLIKHDQALIDRLYFELLDCMSVEERRIEMEAKIAQLTSSYSQRYYSPGYLFMEMRDLSGLINEHVKITKDKFGDVALNIQMLCQMLEKNESNLIDESFEKAYTFNIYVIVRTYKILVQITKLHEDLQYDLKVALECLGEQIGRQDNLMKLAIRNALDINWLLRFEIPTNITDKVKELKQLGFLK